jgi:hypothetical protein
MYFVPSVVEETRRDIFVNMTSVFILFASAPVWCAFYFYQIPPQSCNAPKTQPKAGEGLKGTEGAVSNPWLKLSELHKPVSSCEIQLKFGPVLLKVYILN